MMRCNQCRHELPDGSLFCDACGASLLPGAASSSTETPHVPSSMGGIDPASLARAQSGASAHSGAQAKGPGGLSWIRHTTPPQMQRTEVTPATPISTQPRAQASAATPAHPQQTQPDVAATKRRIRLRLMAGKTFELKGKQRYVVGRRDPHGEAPEVDLTDWDGAASGVSRQHLAIHVSSEGVSIEDLESLNETILNGYRLLPRQRYPLEDGDEVRLGSISLLVVIS